MRPQTQNRRPRAVSIFAAIAVLITALSGFGSGSSDHVFADAGHRAGITGEVRIVTEARLAWVTCSEGRRT